MNERLQNAAPNADSEILNYICRNTEMGLEGIKQILDVTEDPKMEKELKKQHGYYEDVYRKAKAKLAELGEEPKPVSEIAKFSANMMTKGKTMFDDSSSKIAEMMIQGSTMGVVKLTEQLHAYEGDDKEIRGLADQLIGIEEEYIEELKSFL